MVNCDGNCDACDDLCDEYIKAAAKQVTTDKYSIQSFKRQIIEGIMKNLKINVHGLTPITIEMKIDEKSIMKKLNKIKIVENKPHLSFTIQ